VPHYPIDSRVTEVWRVRHEVTLVPMAVPARGYQQCFSRPHSLVALCKCDFDIISSYQSLRPARDLQHHGRDEKALQANLIDLLTLGVHVRSGLQVSGSLHRHANLLRIDVVVHQVEATCQGYLFDFNRWVRIPHTPHTSVDVSGEIDQFTHVPSSVQPGPQCPHAALLSCPPVPSPYRLVRRVTAQVDSNRRSKDTVRENRCSSPRTRKFPATPDPRHSA